MMASRHVCTFGCTSTCTLFGARALKLRRVLDDGAVRRRFGDDVEARSRGGLARARAPTDKDVIVALHRSHEGVPRGRRKDFLAHIVVEGKDDLRRLSAQAPARRRWVQWTRAGAPHGAGSLAEGDGLSR